MIALAEKICAFMKSSKKVAAIYEDPGRPRLAIGNIHATLNVNAKVNNSLSTITTPHARAASNITKARPADVRNARFQPSADALQPQQPEPPTPTLVSHCLRQPGDWIGWGESKQLLAQWYCTSSRSAAHQNDTFCDVPSNTPSAQPGPHLAARGGGHGRDHLLPAPARAAHSGPYTRTTSPTPSPRSRPASILTPRVRMPGSVGAPRIHARAQDPRLRPKPARAPRFTPALGIYAHAQDSHSRPGFAPGPSILAPSTLARTQRSRSRPAPTPRSTLAPRSAPGARARTRRPRPGPRSRSDPRSDRAQRPRPRPGPCLRPAPHPATARPSSTVMAPHAQIHPRPDDTRARPALEHALQTRAPPLALAHRRRPHGPHARTRTRHIPRQHRSRVGRVHTQRVPPCPAIGQHPAGPAADASGVWLVRGPWAGEVPGNAGTPSKYLVNVSSPHSCPAITAVITLRHRSHARTWPSQTSSYPVIAAVLAPRHHRRRSRARIPSSQPLAPRRRSRARAPSSSPRSYSDVAAVLILRHRRRARTPPLQTRSHPAIAAVLVPRHRSRARIPSSQPRSHPVIANALAPVITAACIPSSQPFSYSVIVAALVLRRRCRARSPTSPPRSHSDIADALAPFPTSHARALPSQQHSHPTIAARRTTTTPAPSIHSCTRTSASLKSADRVRWCPG
ncbi:hypothetical protein FIBSPDRAFT_966971 [Athelia psychrophila]|uniref:Uncharacterized protein n=1 Tax=Athelia psychrophila TaxID=1759441 RepID=A0A167W7S4_9AGAM|nr:hypothetical protein FIBSPDRAFT_966971 [Fibularhizoctonia sp. CBS 109695]